jgi:hypothetical protein
MLAGDAVHIEPVSKLNSLKQGKIQGNLPKVGPSKHWQSRSEPKIWALSTKFPKHQNREFWKTKQGKQFREQGICPLIPTAQA